MKQCLLKLPFNINIMSTLHFIIRVSLVLCYISFQRCCCKIHHKVFCDENNMVVNFRKPAENDIVYLNNLKHYPEVLCKPILLENEVIFNLSLSNIFQCGITKISQINGLDRYYHRIILENYNDSNSKDFIDIKCIKNKTSIIDDSNRSNNAGDDEHNINNNNNNDDDDDDDDGNHDITRRSVLPASFYEQDDVEVATTVEKNVPEPTLHIEVRQGSNIINGEVNVKPGTPLTMEISLDKESSAVYGILVSYMHVSDTKSQDEAIIFNGCSVNPSLFENFNTVDGDFLTARFRAFKFPDSTYVQFIGTVSVCLDRCKGIECSNGYTGYGRRKREIINNVFDPKKVFEISLTAFIKVGYN